MFLNFLKKIRRMFLEENDPQFQRIQLAFEKSSGVSTDTRAASNDQLFFALKGENFNGNLYAEKALQAGCNAVVVDEDACIPEGDERYILVPNALHALQSLARWHRRKWACPVIGMTGSNGKTTTKELIKCVLETAHSNVHATYGNLNNHIGVPLTLLAARNEPDVAIIEMGANAQKEIALLAQIAEPNIAVITNIGRAHLEGFGGEEGILKGKGELFDYMRRQRPEDPVFVHVAHPKLLGISVDLKRHLYGDAGYPPFISSALNEHTFAWTGPSGSDHGPIEVNIPGNHNRENIMTAIAIGLHCGATEAEASRAVAEYTPTNNRSQWTVTDHNRLLLDAYNANPSSMQAALNSFKQLTSNAALTDDAVCILGDMAELGSFTASAHEEILDLAIELGLRTYSVGPCFLRAAQDRPAVQPFPDTQSAMAHFTDTPLSGKQILLKGSRSIALEGLAEVL